MCNVSQQLCLSSHFRPQQQGYTVSPFKSCRFHPFLIMRSSQRSRNHSTVHGKYLHEHCQLSVARPYHHSGICFGASEQAVRNITIVCLPLSRVEDEHRQVGSNCCMNSLQVMHSGVWHALLLKGLHQSKCECTSCDTFRTDLKST